MIDHGSVTYCLHRLTAGDSEALDPLWRRYYDRVVGLARTRLRRLDVRAADEEDVATSVFHQFYRAALDNRLTRLANRDDLWRVLVTLTARKAVDFHKHQARKKRGGGTHSVAASMASTVLDPATSAQAIDEVRALFERLPNDEVREIARLKLDGHSNEEIADRLGRTVRTITRRLTLIRSIWNSTCQ